MMFDNTLFFCFGDYRDGMRRYRIFPVESVPQAHWTADTLGFKVLLDEAPKFERIADLEERMADAILSSVHQKLHGIENTVSCIRTSRESAEALERHFMEADIRDYFPKILKKPVDLGEAGRPILFSRRPSPWMLDIIGRELKAKRRPNPKVAPMQLCYSRQSALTLRETTSGFLRTEEERHYDGIATAVVFDEGLKKGYCNLSDYLDWIRDFVIPRLNEIETNIASVEAILKSSQVDIGFDPDEASYTSLAAARDRVNWLREELLSNHVRNSFFMPDLEAGQFRPKYVSLIDTLHLCVTWLLHKGKLGFRNESEPTGPTLCPETSEIPVAVIS